MRKKAPRNRPHSFTDQVHAEVAGQTPIIPQRGEQVEGGRKREFQPRERVGEHTERELHNVPFPPEK